MPSYDSKTALLGSVIDYAGTFPPAALPLEKALERAASFRNQARHPWLFAKVALPLSDIKKLSAKALFGAGSDGSPWLFTALGSAVTEPGAAAFERTLEWELREIAHLNDRRLPGSIRQCIVAYETKLPVDASGGLRHELTHCLEVVLEKMPELLGDRVDPYFELVPDANWVKKLIGLAEALSDWADRHRELGIVPGIKVRTGGAVIPSPGELSEILVTCIRYGLHFKATQGLHAAVTQDKAMGFVNLFAALALGGALGEEEFGKDQIKACLECEDPKAFVFGEKTLRWEHYEVTSELIEAARRRHAATFGSCSLDEPDESLSQVFGK